MVAKTAKTRKAKGRKFQQEIARRISEVTGIPVEKDGDIESRPMGQSGPDVILRGKAAEKFPFVVEAKFQERWNIHKWIQQARQRGKNWLLFCERSRKEPIVCMSIDTFFDIYDMLLHYKSKLEEI